MNPTIDLVFCLLFHALSSKCFVSWAGAPAGDFVTPRGFGMKHMNLGKKKFFVQVFSVGHVLSFIPKLWVCKGDAKKMAKKQKIRKGDSDGEVRRSLSSTQLYFQLHLSIGFCTV